MDLSERRQENDERKLKADRKQRKSVDYLQFVNSWMDIYQQGGSRRDLAKLLDISYEALSGRADKLRKRGLELPELPTGNFISNVQIKELAAIVNQRQSVPSTAPHALKEPPVI